jgi:hypothetical protein
VVSRSFFAPRFRQPNLRCTSHAAYGVENSGLSWLNAKSCQALAQPLFNISDPGAGRPAYDNACLRAADDTSVQITMLVPNAPVKADKASNLGTVATVGVTRDGVPIFADAPSVLDTGHLPALDTLILVGVVAKNNFSTTAKTGIGSAKSWWWPYN